MEAPFVLFIIGLSIWGMKTLISAKIQQVPWYLFLVTGLAIGTVLSLIIGSSLLPPLVIPWYLLGLMGGIASLLLYLAYRFQWFFKAGLEYVVSLVLGGVLAVIFYFLFAIYLKSQKLDIIIHSYNTTLWFSMILMGFVIILGYSFPERFQKRRQTEKQGPIHE